MKHTNKMSYFANFRMLNRLILQFSFAQTVLFCNSVIIVKFPKVRSTQFELVINCHRLTLKLVRGFKKVYFFAIFSLFGYFSCSFLSLYRSQKVIRPAEAYIWLFVAQSL